MLTHKLTFRISATSAYNKRAACGSRSQQFANEPTCPKCKQHIQADKDYVARMIAAGKLSAA